MWYLAAITLASTEPSSTGAYTCEECNVLFESETASGAYAKAVAWAHGKTGESTSLLGIKHLTTVGPELGEGVDVCGRIFTAEEVWKRQHEFSTQVEKLGAMFSETTMDVPISEALGSETAARLIEHLRQIAPDLRFDGPAT